MITKTAITKHTSNYCRLHFLTFCTLHNPALSYMSRHNRSHIWVRWCGWWRYWSWKWLSPHKVLI